MWVIVLNDGETYTAVDGSSVLYVPTSVDDIDGFVKENVKEKGIKVALCEVCEGRIIGEIFVPRQDYEE